MGSNEIGGGSMRPESTTEGAFKSALPGSTVCIAVPVDLVPLGNALARCIGLSAEDERTFDLLPNTEDGSGNLYVFVSGWISQTFVGIATSEIEEPEWGCDLVAAELGQSKVVQDAPATPEIIAAMVTNDQSLALSTFGLTRVVQDGDP